MAGKSLGSVRRPHPAGDALIVLYFVDTLYVFLYGFKAGSRTIRERMPRGTPGAQGLREADSVFFLVIRGCLPHARAGRRGGGADVIQTATVCRAGRRAGRTPNQIFCADHCGLAL